MIKNKLLIFVMVFVFAITLINANGLRVIESSVYVNKTIGQDKNITITIANEEPVNFLNLTLEDSSIVKMPMIASIASGTNMSVTLTVKTDEDIVSSFRIKGFYETNIGETNALYEVNFSKPLPDLNGMSRCDFSIIKSDSVKWYNYAFSTACMRQLPGEHPVDGGDIARGNSFTKKFTEAGSFSYAFYMCNLANIPISNTCTITILPTTGLINDPNKDAILNLNIKVSYEPTIINYSFSNTNMRMGFLDTQEGVISITNIGNKVARNIKLTGDSWFTFSANNFDLSPGVTKPILYTITPQIYMTIDTNKTYNKTVTITGNFPTASQDFQVYVDYALIGSGDNSTGDLQTLLEKFCKDHPKSQFCDPEPQIVYRDTNRSDYASNVTITQAQFRDIWIHLFESDEARQTLDNYIKENIDLLRNQSNSNTEIIARVDSTMTQQKEDQETALKGVIIFVIIVLILVCCGVIGMLIYIKRKQNRAEGLRRF